MVVLWLDWSSGFFAFPNTQLGCTLQGADLYMPGFTMEIHGSTLSELPVLCQITYFTPTTKRPPGIYLKTFVGGRSSWLHYNTLSSLLPVLFFPPSWGSSPLKDSFLDIYIYISPDYDSINTLFYAIFKFFKVFTPFNSPCVTSNKPQ